MEQGTYKTQDRFVLDPQGFHVCTARSHAVAQRIAACLNACAAFSTEAIASGKVNEPMRALESLTPNGSEYVNDIERCVSHVRERFYSSHERLLKSERENRRLRAWLERIERNADLAIKDMARCALAGEPEDAEVKP